MDAPHLIATPGSGESEKLKKGVELCCRGRSWTATFPKGEGWTDTFPIYFFQGLSFLHLEITLPFAKLCYAFEEKNFFSATIVLGKS